ncbi:hypothetical protein P691DRAFT_803701 [Macrolepiota fuliginosa MF-IS2]|uniref:TERF2-interacting telomeric protein 1 Myb domain-containing protein n=1 Tax=Macrolepiota fuliginosa MF-IS2 TaxID=1400762 RepID=A0A9P6C0G2_9AGAR|nr:hypothetical protein P691DRAFT_803701 [Macrolepiota fuliginosa MF-IS2]
MSGRNTFSSAEDVHLVEYIARARPNPAGRQGNEIYKILVEDADRWPWGQKHSWQSWREHYRNNKAKFDRKIAKYQKEQNIDPDEEVGLGNRHSQRNEFTSDEDRLLVKYLATYNPQLRGRNGNETFKRLVNNAEKKWNWSKTHTWHSWRHRYVSNEENFNRAIKKYQERHGIPVPLIPKLGTVDSRVERPTKRQKIIEEADSQETEWAKIDWSTPRQGEAPTRTQSRNHDQNDKEVVLREPRRNEPRRARPSVQKEPSENSQGEGDESDYEDDGEPPNSEDYVGEIFQEPNEDEGGGPPTSATDDDRQDSPDVDLRGEHINGHLDVPSKEGMLKGTLPIPEQSDAVKVERPSPKSPPKPPPKPRPSVNHHNFTLLSQSQRRHNDDPFEDSQSSPEKDRALKASRKRPPKLLEGAFGNRLNRKRPRKVMESSTDDSDEEVEPPWPPQRTIANTHVLPPSQDKNQSTQAGKITKKKVVEDKAVEQRRREKGKEKAVDVDDHDSSPDGKGARRPSEPRSPQTQLSDVQDTPGAGPSRIGTVRRQHTDTFLPPPPPATLIPKRHSTGGIISSTASKNSTSRTINFRQEFANKVLRQPVHRPSSRTSHTSSVISEEDNQLFQQLGIQMAIHLLSEEFGFTEAVVRELWTELKSLRVLRDALNEMKESADRTMTEYIEGISMVSRNSDYSPAGSVRKSMTKSPATAMATPASVATSGSATNRRKRKSSIGLSGKALEIRPVDMGEASAAMEAEYAPLSGTRAGKYLRLAKMGREDEALEREQRRVSSIALSPRRDLFQQQEQEQGDDQRQARGDEEGADEGESGSVVDEVEIEIQDMDDDEIDDDEQVFSAPPNGNAVGETHEVDQVDEQQRHMEVDSPSPRIEEHQASPDQQDTEHQEHRPEDSETEILKVNDDLPLEGDDDEIVNIESDPSGEAEVVAMVQGDAERWKNYEHLFRAANRHNVTALRELEKTFDPGFLMQWLGNQVELR